MIPEIRHLETLYWIGELGSYGAAARKLNTTQPNLSQRIREMEQRLGVMLINTAYKRANLTPKGRELAAYARDILALHADAWHAVADNTAVSGTVRVGSTETIAVSWLSSFASYVSRYAPGIELGLHVDVADKLRSLVNEGSIDLALTISNEDGYTREDEDLGVLDLFWMAAPETFAASATSVEEIAKVPIITFPSDSRLYQESQRWFAKAGVEPKRYIVCNSMAAVIALVRDGIGASILPPSVIAEASPMANLVEIDVSPKIPPIGFEVYHQNTPLSPAVSTVVEIARFASTFQKHTKCY